MWVLFFVGLHVLARVVVGVQELPEAGKDGDHATDLEVLIRQKGILKGETTTAHVKLCYQL
jgi:hypothetical protein